MATDQPTPGTPDGKKVLDVVVKQARENATSDVTQSRIYQAISVQRPVVLEYLKSLRRDKPDATAAEILTALDKRYVTTVTATSTGVGASAAIPVVGTGIALALGVADLVFFYEISALYVLAATELHGIEVTDAERARPLVFAMLLGEKSQSKVARLVFQAAGAGGVTSGAQGRRTSSARRRSPRAGERCSPSNSRTRRSRRVATVIASRR